MNKTTKGVHGFYKKKQAVKNARNKRFFIEDIITCFLLTIAVISFVVFIEIPNIFVSSPNIHLGIALFYFILTLYDEFLNSLFQKNNLFVNFIKFYGQKNAGYTLAIVVVMIYLIITVNFIKVNLSKETVDVATSLVFVILVIVNYVKYYRCRTDEYEKSRH